MATQEATAGQEAGFAPDVVVIGGGPAGSTISALLSERGYDVVLLEKNHHPRFHIGESLLPLNLPLFEQLGVSEQIAAIGIPKYAAEFISPDHDHTSRFEFAGALDKSFPYSYEVRRSEFDEILFRHAATKGADAIEGCEVLRVEFQQGGNPRVVTRLEDGSERVWQPKFVVDATGRETLLSNQFDIKRRNRKHASASVYGHFANAERRSGKDEGNISLFWFEHGWFWYIPLRDGTVSVGVVCWPYYMKSRKTDMERFFFDTVALCPPLQARLKEATLVSAVTATGNFSYSSERCSGPGYIMIGDAFTFIDPVFSSGVFLAMNSAFIGADAVEACLKQPERARHILKDFEKKSRHGLKIFSWIIYRMTSPAMRDLFMNPSNVFRLQETLLSVLAGDLYRGTPIRLRMAVFKLVYYIMSLKMLGKSYHAWRRRKQSIRNVALEGMTS